MCTMKERCWVVVSTLPFKVLMPKLIVTNIKYLIVLWLNTFPVQNGVSKVYSPRSIITCTRLSWKRHYKVIFGTYCEVLDEPDPANDMTPRIHRGIAVGPTRNIQCTHKFFCVNTGPILMRQNFTK